MGIPKRVDERLARLEARVAALPDPEAERERERVARLHADTWFDGGSLEDIPEKDRDPQLWEIHCSFGPGFLKMVLEGQLYSRDELLAEGIDFTPVEGIDEEDVRAYINGISGPNTPPHKP